MVQVAGSYGVESLGQWWGDVKSKSSSPSSPWSHDRIMYHVSNGTDDPNFWGLPPCLKMGNIIWQLGFGVGQDVGQPLIHFPSRPLSRQHRLSSGGPFKSHGGDRFLNPQTFSAQIVLRSEVFRRTIYFIMTVYFMIPHANYQTTISWMPIWFYFFHCIHCEVW